ncbi:MAG TPA: branched-chain amino acid ABC transporter permease [Rhodocyclaceae bacterium]|nr:branched-chain amino acid ABC transporter permease [Rhodocyclaceae bacterium]
MDRALEAEDKLPKQKKDYVPMALAPVIALAAIPLVGDISTWVTLTIAGIGMGMIIFLAASGFSLVFGLMDVLNFGHGIFITLGAYLGSTVLTPATMPLVFEWFSGESLGLSLLAIAIAAVIGMLITALVGVAFERVIVRPVYGSPLAQILVTTGGMIVAGELIIALWGPNPQVLTKPAALAGALIFGDIAIEKYRLMTLVVGLLVFGLMQLILVHTRAGMLIRAAVQDREMVEALGYRVKYLFLVVFAVGAALAALGGIFWGMYQDNIDPTLGAQLMIVIFIVLIIGGMGSIMGSFIGAILVGLVTNYMAFSLPIMTAFSTIILMCAVILWRPNGLYPVVKR